jgi:hypothetical protein
LRAIVLDAVTADDAVMARLAQVRLRFDSAGHQASGVGSGLRSRTMDGAASQTGQRSASSSATSRSA